MSPYRQQVQLALPRRPSRRTLAYALVLMPGVSAVSVSFLYSAYHWYAYTQPQLERELPTAITHDVGKDIADDAAEWRRTATGRCPTMTDLGRSEVDVWGSQFVIECHATINVRSAGPDRAYFTADDLVDTPR